MALYIGFYRGSDNYQRWLQEKQFSGDMPLPTPGVAGAPDPRMQEKVRGFPAFLESRGVKLIGSYAPVGSGAGTQAHPTSSPGVTLIETDNEADLMAITQYYGPFLVWSFHRYKPVARP